MKNKALRQCINSILIAGSLLGSASNLKAQAAPISGPGSGEVCPGVNYYYQSGYASVGSCTPNDDWQWTVSGGTIISGQGTSLIEVVWTGCPDGQDVHVAESYDCDDGSWGYATNDIVVSSSSSCYASASVSISPATITCGNTGTVTITANKEPYTTTYTWTLPTGFTFGTHVGNGVATFTTTTDVLTGVAVTANGHGYVTVGESIGPCNYSESASANFVRSSIAPTSFTGGTIYFCGPSMYGKPETYTVKPVSGATSYTYSITGPTGGASFTSSGITTTMTSSATSQTVYFTIPGAYTLCAAANNTCSTSTETCETINVYSVPPSQPTLTGAAPPAACPQFQWNLTASDANTESYIWSNSNKVDFTLGATTTSTGYNSLSMNDYSKSTLVTVIASNACGTSPSRISSFYSASSAICSKYTKNPDKQDSVNALPNAMYAESEFKLYPNPANTTLAIDYKLSDVNTDASIEVYDLLGAKVSEWTLSVNRNNFVANIAALPNGLYVYVITQSGNILQRGKVVIQH